MTDLLINQFNYMSTWSRLVDTLQENKVVVASVAGAAVAFIVYRAFIRPKINVLLMDERQRFLYDVELLKGRINLEALGKSDLEEILSLMMKETHRRLGEHNVTFKKIRRAVKSSNFKTYLKVLVQGLNRMQQITVLVHSDVLKNLGISQQRFQIATMQHPQLMSFMPKLQVTTQSKQLTLKQTRQALDYQKSYLFYHGQQLVDQLKYHSHLIEEFLPLLFKLIINDERHKALGFDDEQIESALLKYKDQLKAEINQIEEEVTPYINQLSMESQYSQEQKRQQEIQDSNRNDSKAQDQYMKMMGIDPSILDGMDSELFGYESPNKAQSPQVKKQEQHQQEQNEEELGQDDPQDPQEDEDQQYEQSDSQFSQEAEDRRHN